MPSPYPRVSEIIAEGPLKKSKLYQLALANPGLIKKIGKTSVIDREKYYEILAAAPAATFRNPERVTAAPKPKATGGTKPAAKSRRAA
jgi:hypothetical protein